LTRDVSSTRVARENWPRVEHACAGVELHRFDSLDLCCDDLASDSYQDELTTYLESLDEAVMGPVCVAADFTK